jgi:hypothetical protein
MWSTHSRRIDPISRSAKPFCQGEAGFPDAHGAQSACDDAAIDPVTIADEVTRSFDVAPIPIRRAEDADTSSTEIGALDRERGGRSPMGASSSLAGTELRPHHCRASSQLFAFML